MKHSSQHSYNRYVPLCVASGGEGTAAELAVRISHLLKENGIESISHGSRGAEILTREEDMSRARELISEDAARQGYNVAFY